MQKKKKQPRNYSSINVIKQTSEINDPNKSVTLIRKVFRCLDCCFIPLLDLKENDTKIQLNCLQGHEKEISLKDYMISGFSNSLDRIKCNKCGLLREAKMIFKLCEECNIIMCRDCLKDHNSKYKKHHIISVRKMDTICCLHQSKFTFFCKKCNKNLCDECLSEHKKEEHDLVCLNEIKLNNIQIEEIKKKLEKEKENINEIINVFNENMINLQNKFDDIIKDKRQVLKYKKNIFESYELKDINYQVIENLIRLKFDFIPFKVEPNSDELTNINKLFDYLIEKDNKKKSNKYSITKEKELYILKQEDKKESIEIDLNFFVIVKEKELFISKQDKKKIDLNIFSIIKENDLFITKQEIKKIPNIVIKNDNFMINKIKTKKVNKNKIDNNINFTIKKGSKKIIKNKIDFNISFIIKKKYSARDPKNINQIDNRIGFTIKKKGKKNKLRIDNGVSLYIKKSKKKFKDNKNKMEKNIDFIIKKKNTIKGEKKNKYKMVRNFSFTIRRKIKRIKISEKKEKENKSTKNTNNNESKKDIVLKEKTHKRHMNSESNLEDKEKYTNLDKEIKNDKIKKIYSNRESKKINQFVIKKEEGNEINDYNSNYKNEELKMNMNKKNFLEFMNKINEIPSIENLEFSASSIKLVKNLENLKIKPKNNNLQKKIFSIQEDELDSNNNEQSFSIQLPKSPSFKEINFDKKQIESFVCDQSEQLGFIFDEMMEDKLKKNNNSEHYSERKDKEKKIENLNKKKLEKDLQINEHKNNNKVKTINTMIDEKNNSDKKNNNKKNYTNSKNTNATNKKMNMSKSVFNITQNTTEASKNNINTNTNNNSINPKITNEVDKKLIRVKSSDKIRKRRKKRYFGKLSPIDDEEDFSFRANNRTFDFGEENKDELERLAQLEESRRDIHIDHEKKKKINTVNNDNEDNNFSFNVEKSDKIANYKNNIIGSNIKNKNNVKKISFNNEDKKKICRTPNTKEYKSGNKRVFIKNNNLNNTAQKNNEKTKIIIVKKSSNNSKKNSTNNSINNGNNNSNNNSIKINNKNIKAEKKTSMKTIITSPKKVCNNQINNNKILSPKININVIKNEQINNINNIRNFVQKPKEKVLYQKVPKKEERFREIGDLSKSFDNILNKEKIHKKQNMLNENIVDGLNQSFDASKNKKLKISVVHYFSSKEKINRMEFENGISCIIEIRPEIFCIGDLIGKIKLFNLNTFNEILSIFEHHGTINSLFLLHNGAILSTSADKRMKKISFKDNFKSYNVDFIFNGYNNFILKGIELKGNHKIISCTWDKKILIWEKDNGQSRIKKEYLNTDIYTEKDRIIDILEITLHEFATLSESELKFWDSSSYEKLYIIKNEKKYGETNSLCKIDDDILAVNYYQHIQFINIVEKNIINSIKICDGDLSQMIKLNDNSILIAEEKNSENYNIFYVKQYEYTDGFLDYISFKRNKYIKKNKKSNKEIRALLQFSGGIIVQSVCGENNGKIVGELIFYK